MIAQRATRFFRRFLPLLVLAMGLALNARPARAETEEEKPAVAAMEIWLKGIDEGKYAESWEAASKNFRSAISSVKWVAALEAVRKPLGVCSERKLASALHQKTVPAGDKTLSGDFVIAQFESSFANLKFAIETVTFEKEGGDWKASGYYIKPR